MLKKNEARILHPLPAPPPPLARSAAEYEFAHDATPQIADRRCSRASESGAGGGQPFLISDLASVVVDEMEIRGEEEGTWVLAAGGGVLTWSVISLRCCSKVLFVLAFLLLLNQQ